MDTVRSSPMDTSLMRPAREMYTLISRLIRPVKAHRASSSSREAKVPAGWSMS